MSLPLSARTPTDWNTHRSSQLFFPIWVFQDCKQGCDLAMSWWSITMLFSPKLNSFPPGSLRLLTTLFYVQWNLWPVMDFFPDIFLKIGWNAWSNLLPIFHASWLRMLGTGYYWGYQWSWNKKSAKCRDYKASKNLILRNCQNPNTTSTQRLGFSKYDFAYHHTTTPPTQNQQYISCY